MKVEEPTLEDVKAMIRAAVIHEQSNAMNGAHLYWKTAANHAVQIAESLERENAELRDVLRDLVKAHQDWNASVQSITGETPGWTDAYLRPALELLAKHKEGR